MNSVLSRISAAIGGISFLAALSIGFINEVSMPVALCRAGIVMIVSTIAASAFLRFFTNMLLQFVAQRVVEMKKAKQSARKETSI
jgi:hypothetical protein